jgi:hypothetical protein
VRQRNDDDKHTITFDPSTEDEGEGDDENIDQGIFRRDLNTNSRDGEKGEDWVERENEKWEWESKEEDSERIHGEEKKLTTRERIGGSATTRWE